MKEIVINVRVLVHNPDDVETALVAKIDGRGFFRAGISVKSFIREAPKSLPSR